MAECMNGLLAKAKFNLRPKEEIQMYLKEDLLQLFLTVLKEKVDVSKIWSAKRSH